MKVFQEFLESSTIHGLSYISTSKSLLVKTFWLLVVVVCFSFSGYLIVDSFLDWEHAPVATSEETKPIQDVNFPKITVCPPRGSHTALNYYLEEAKHMRLNDSQKRDLVALAGTLVEDRESWEIMMDNMQFKERNRFRNWYEGKSQVQFHFERIRFVPSAIQTFESAASGGGNSFIYSNNFKFVSSEASGSVETPWFEEGFDEETFYSAVSYRFGLV